MNIGVVSDELSLDFESALRRAALVHIDRFELRSLSSGRVPYCSAGELRTLKHAVLGAGARLTALSPGLFKATESKADVAHDLRETLPRTLDLALALDIQNILIFGFAKERHTQELSDVDMLEAFSLAADSAEHAGVVLHLEPEPVCVVDTGLAALSIVGHEPRIRINYDPGNVAWQTGIDPSSEIAQIKEHIARLHVKDLLPLKDLQEPHWCNPGQGLVDYDRIFRESASISHLEITLEPHMPLTDSALMVFVQACRRLIDQP